jgi:hypothetical protein
VCRSKHVEPSINFGIINSITELHLVGISTESSTMHKSMNIKIIQGAEETLNAYAATRDTKRYCASAVFSQGNSI